MGIGASSEEVPEPEIEAEPLKDGAGISGGRGSGDDSHEYMDFAQLWERYAPSGSGGPQTMSRSLAKQVVLRAMTRGVEQTPQATAYAEGIIHDQLGTSPPTCSFHEAFSALCVAAPRVQAEVEGPNYCASSPGAESSTGTESATMSFLSRGGGGDTPHTTPRSRRHAGENQGYGRSPPPTPEYVGDSSLASPPSHQLHPRGARMIDPAVPSLRRKTPMGSSAGSDAGDTMSRTCSSRTAEQIAADAEPVRQSRAALESVNAVLRSTYGAMQATYGRKALQAEGLRLRLARGGEQADLIEPDGDFSKSAGVVDLPDMHRSLNSQRVRALALEAELTRSMDRFRFSANIAEKQRRELASLREGCTAQTERSRQALRRRDEAFEKLQIGREDHSDLTRKAKTEQLRASMLREAFEQEQERVGLSLGRADAYVCDLVAATEATRKVEVEEQSLARECLSAISEIAAAEARDQEIVESHIAVLRRELEDAQANLSTRHVGTSSSSTSSPHDSFKDDADTVRAMASYSKAEAQQHDASTELAEVRRRCHGLSAIVARRAENAERIRQDANQLRARSQTVSEELRTLLGSDGGGVGNQYGGGRPARLVGASARLQVLQPRLRLEEAAETSLRVAEARLRDELADSRAQGSGGVVAAVADTNDGLMFELDARHCKQSAASAACAWDHFQRLREELGSTQCELNSATDRPSGRNIYTGSSETSTLERRLGVALAGVGQGRMRLQESGMTQQLSLDVNSVLCDYVAKLGGAGDATRSVASPGCITSSPPSGGRQWVGKAENHASELRNIAANLQRTQDRLRPPKLEQSDRKVNCGGGLIDNDRRGRCGAFFDSDSILTSSCCSSPKLSPVSPQRGAWTTLPNFSIDPEDYDDYGDDDGSGGFSYTGDDTLDEAMQMDDVLSADRAGNRVAGQVAYDGGLVQSGGGVDELQKLREQLKALREELDVKAQRNISC